MVPDDEVATTQTTEAEKGGAPAETVEMVPRTELAEAIEGRQKAKDAARATTAQLDALIEANDGQPLTVEEIKAMREAKTAAAQAEEEAAKKRGDFDDLLNKKDADHRTALDERDVKFNELESSYREEKLGALTGRLLAKREVLPEAVEAAQRDLVRDGDPKQGVRMAFVQDKETKKWVAKLVDTAGSTAIDSETGKDLSFDTFMERHKQNHPYYYVREVKPGSGSGSDSTSTDSRSTLEEQLQAALDAKDQKAYREISNKLFNLDRK